VHKLQLSSLTDRPFYVKFIMGTSGAKNNLLVHMKNRRRLSTGKFIKNGIFWGVRPYGSCKNRRFGRT
jgi:hypothetical protein